MQEIEALQNLAWNGMHCHNTFSHRSTTTISSDIQQLINSSVPYFAFLDDIIQHVVDRFEQTCMKTYSQMESHILEACHREIMSQDAKDITQHVWWIRPKLSRVPVAYTAWFVFLPCSYMHHAWLYDIFRQKCTDVRWRFWTAETAATSAGCSCIKCHCRAKFQLPVSA